MQPITDAVRERLLAHLPRKIDRARVSGIALQGLLILDELYDGLYHVSEELHRRKPEDFYDVNRFAITVYNSPFSTYDFNYLTRFVVFCHDRCVRGSIESAARGLVWLVFHPRYNRDGSMYVRHPELEEHIAAIRGVKR